MTGDAGESAGPRRFALAVAAAAALLAPPVGGADSSPAPPTAPSVSAPSSSVAPVRLIVRFRAGAGAASAAQTLDRANVAQVAAIPQADTHVVEVPADAAAQTLADLNADPSVAYAEPDGIATAALAPDDPLIQGPIGWIWNDFAFPAGWDVTTGSSSIVIADLDSGVNAGHPDLAGSVLPGMNFTVSPASTTVADDYGHGTETAGVLVARGNNGIGVAGACWGCKILPVKVLNSSGFGYWSWIESGIYWATDHGARVINLSLGGATGEQSLVDAIDYAVSHGVFVAIAAGNAGSSDPAAGAGGYPAYYAASIPGAVSVGAVDAADDLYSFSNYGSWVEVDASGLGVTTTRDGAYVSNGVTGTSFSAPEVAGLAALALSVDASLTPAQLEQLIRQSTSAGPTQRNQKSGGEIPCGGQCTGGGLLDAHKVLATLAGAPLVAPSASVAPTISGGVVREGIAVTGGRGTWQGDQPIRYGYQWQRCSGGGCVSIAGATGSTYTPVAADVGSTLRFVVTASNSGGAVSAYAETASVRAAPPTNQSPPTISGAVRVGETLTGGRGSWSSAETLSFGYEWQRCSGGACTSIAAATGTTYQVAAADVGRTLRFVVTASNSGGSASASADTPGTVPPPPLNLRAPAIAGTPKDGQTLTGSSGSWTGTGAISYSYRWQRCSGGTCTDIPGAGATTYTATAADVGETLRFVVTAFDSGGSAAAYVDTAVVAALPPALVGGPTITGTLREGQTLTAAAGFSGSDPAIGYEWRRNGTAIPGATGPSYTLVSLDVGATIGVLVTARNSAGTASGTATAGVVEAAPPAPASPSGGSGGGGGGGSIPDLTLEITTDAPPGLGQSVTYRLRVYDKPGYGPTSHATAVFVLPEQVQISSVYLGHGRGCTRQGQTLACDLDFLDPGQEATVVVSGTVTKPGELIAAGSIWAMSEQNTSDDSTRLVLTVADPNAQSQAPSGAAKGSGSKAATPTVIMPLGGPVLGDTLTIALPAAIEGRIQWQASQPVGRARRPAILHWNAIKGATGSQLKPGRALVGRRLRVVVTVGSGARTERLVSAATGPIGRLGPLRPRIVAHRTLTVGAIVTALLPKPLRRQDAGTVRYRWQLLRRRPSRRHGRWITLRGATSSRLTLGESLVGRRLRVVVVAGTGRRQRTVASAAAGPVR